MYKNIRATAGKLFRLVGQYRKNRLVFSKLVDLRRHELTYYSVLDGRRIDESEVLSRIDDGDIIVLKDIIGKLGLQERVDALCDEFFSVGQSEIGDIHQKMSLNDIVTKAMEARDSIPALVLQSSIMQRLLAPHTSEYCLELQPNLRLHLPYKAIKGKEAFIESAMGRGKLNPHGQHKDSWRYHPENTLNVWLAFTPATEANGMAVLPKSANYHPKFDAVRKEIAEGVKTYPSLQYRTNLEAGDALFFKADLLHGSIINTSPATRVVLSMRCTRGEPQFHKRHVYNYMKISGGKFYNLTRQKLWPQANFEPKSTDSCFDELEKRNSSIVPVAYDERRIELKVSGKTLSFPRKCPHAGADLLLGELNKDGQLICPAHQLCVAGRACDSVHSIGGSG